MTFHLLQAYSSNYAGSWNLCDVPRLPASVMVGRVGKEVLLAIASSPPDCNKLEASPQGEMEEYHPTSARKKQEINQSWTYHNIPFHHWKMDLVGKG